MGDLRTEQYLQYLVERGATRRYGPLWAVDDPRRSARIDHELEVINELGFASFFLILYDVMEFCRRAEIPYGPGRGSVGGCYIAYLLGIHEVDSIEYELTFARFLTRNRVGLPDVDIDFSQRRRGEVIDYITETYGDRGYQVLQVAAFTRAGARGTIDAVLAAQREVQPHTADSTALTLRNMLPEGNVTGGTKQARELGFWLYGGTDEPTGSKQEEFEKQAEQAEWLDPLLKLDGFYQNISRHAAGVVILSEEDLDVMPRAGTGKKGEWVQTTGYDMYDLDALKYMKMDILGLRTLDVVADAHKFVGGSGSTPDLMEIWRENKDDQSVYPMFSKGDTLGIFQMETAGYRRTLRDFQPDCFEHIVHLNALYRPGALDYERESDGKNMVEVFIDRRHDREPADYPHPLLENILQETHGVFLYQEQSMLAVQILAGFDDAGADELRKGIGKKRAEVIAALETRFREGCIANGITDKGVMDRVWENISAAARYSWNKAHSVEYGIITWLTAWFKVHHPAAFYAALLNSYANASNKAERQTGIIAEARQRCTISPPDINVAHEGFTVRDDAVVFGLSGLKGIGEANRQAILEERVIPFGSFKDFCYRLPSLPISMKKTLIEAGAFDRLDDRAELLSDVAKAGKPTLEECEDCKGEGFIGDPNEPCLKCEGVGEIEKPQLWTVADHINHNRKLKKPRPIPPIESRPTAAELANRELESIGFYVSQDPLGDVTHVLSRCGAGNHWGGEIEHIYRKKDKNGNEMATLTVLTPSLAKLRVVIFASNWPQNRWIEKGDRIIIRGRESGDDVLADRVFKLDTVEHFRKISATRNGDDAEWHAFDGKLDTILGLESAGYEVRLI